MQWLTAALLVPLALALAPARGQDALLASDVSMDVTGEDANDARTQAMKKAEREGLGQLLDKLAPDQKDAVLADLEDGKISAMVKGVEVLDEKIAGNRYRALLRVSYNALAVSGLVEARAGTPAPEEPPPQSGAVLVVALFEDGGRTWLWEPDNAWRAAWNVVTLEMRGGNVVTPYGDEIDAQVLTIANATSASYSLLLPLFKRYGVSEVVIAKAAYHEKPSPGLEVVRRDIGQARSEVFVSSYRSDPLEQKEALLSRAAHDVAEQVLRQRENLWSRPPAQRTMAAAATDRVLIVVPFSRLSSWTQVRGILLGIPTVGRLDVLAMSAQQVDAVVQFRGPADALSRDLQSSGLRVVESGGYWIVSKE